MATGIRQPCCNASTKLFYDLLWQWKRPAALCLNDAKAAMTKLHSWRSFVLMQVKCTNQCSAKYDKNDTWDEPPYLNGIWQFKPISKSNHLGNANSRDRPRQRQWPLHLGSSELANVWYHVTRWFLCPSAGSNITPATQNHGIRICQQHGSLHHTPIWSSQASDCTHAASGD